MCKPQNQKNLIVIREVFNIYNLVHISIVHQNVIDLTKHMFELKNKNGKR